jgi:iodotyrosine deiodinase
MTQPHDHILLPDFERLDAAQMRDRAEAILANLQRRHSIRAFSDAPVPQDIIQACIAAAGTAPSGANQQPWFFACVGSAELKAQIRQAAEAEERAFYAGKASDEWLDALAPLGTDASKPYLEIAPWLIIIFMQRKIFSADGSEQKVYYANESVGIATGMLITALHTAGLATLTHTPNPMTFLNKICGRPESEKPYLILVTGYPAQDATVPVHAMQKKSLSDIAAFL